MATKNKKANNKDEPKRIGIIEAITAPLGFFVLALLIVESFLATVLATILDSLNNRLYAADLANKSELRSLVRCSSERFLVPPPKMACPRETVPKDVDYYGMPGLRLVIGPKMWRDRRAQARKANGGRSTARG